MSKFIAIAASLFATATLFAITTGTAHAETAVPSIAVSYADLNLATTEGRRSLDRRITRAARALCQIDMPTTGSHIVSNETKECYRLAMLTAHQQIAAALENSKHGG